MPFKKSPKPSKPSHSRPQPKAAGKAPSSPFRTAASGSTSTKSGGRKSSPARSGNSKFGDSRSGDSSSGDSRQDRPKSAQSRPAQSRPAQSRSASAQPKSAPAKSAQKDSSAFPAPKAATPSIPSALISRRASDAIRGGHLWVYATDIEAINASKENPQALLPVADNRGIPLGTALYSPNSQIALRFVSRELITEAQWHALLAERLRAAIHRRAPLLNEANNAARLVFSEADNLPGLILDKYAGVVILQLLAKGLDNPATRKICVETIAQSLPDDTLTIWERPDPRIRQLEGLSAPATTPLYHRSPAKTQSETESASEASTIFHINGLSLHFDAQSGQKTGAFLDQRENYAAAARWAKSRGIQKALDICTYQGGFALHLAQAGCQVTAVDQSRAALEVAERNLTLNREQGHLPANTEIEWLEADAFNLLHDWASQTRAKSPKNSSDSPETPVDSREPWQLIVLDPPAFAKSQRAVEGAMRGYKELNLRALQLLAPGGLLVTCSCSHHVSLSDLESAVASAANDAGRRVTLLERRGASLDHPTILNLPETEYLKCLILAVD